MEDSSDANYGRLRRPISNGVYPLLFFLVLTIIATYPLPQHMATTLVEPGDSLLNTWVISWDIKKLITDPVNLFHANIFYPYKYTLAYTENLLGNALLGMPVYLVTNNPILTYNFVFLATFIIGGWGMFLLVRYLTRSSLAGIIAGIIFVYNPHRFYEVGHIHVLSIHWLPFALLYLHRYFQNRRNKDLFLFCTFFIFQAATSGHIGLYQSFIVGLFLFFILISRENIWGKHWLKLGLGLGIASLVLLPLYLPYMHLAKELEFVRPEGELKLYSASFESFGGIIFPGILASVLAILGIFHSRPKTGKYPKSIVLLLNICILITMALIVYVIIFGGFDLGYSILGVKLKVYDLKNPFLILLGLLIIKLLLQRKSFQPSRFYLVLAVASFLFCLGPEIELKETFTGPYIFLYDYFPGFKGLRVPSRWAVVFILAVAVLAGLGWKRIERRNWTKWAIFPLVLIILLRGYISIPLTLRFTIWKKPPVYEWLARQPDEDVVIELPMPEWYSSFYHEAVYMYWSLFHNKRMINGYSGYSPPTYWPIVELMRSFPSEDSIHLLQYLDVKYIILHGGVEGRKMRDFEQDLVLRYKDDNDYVYELISTFQPEGKQPPLTPLGAGLTGLASHHPEKVEYAYDNDMTTRWDTGQAQSAGMWFQLDLGEMSNIGSITLQLGQSPNDYPRSVKLEVSENGVDWREVEIRLCYSEFIINLMKSLAHSKMDLNFAPTLARYVRLSVTKENPVFYWSIYEIEVATL